MRGVPVLTEAESREFLELLSDMPAKKGVPVLTEAEFKAWMERLLELYPQVETVALVGSRASGYARPGSDWDVILCLEEGCYQEDEEGYPVQRDKIEQRIAFEPALRSEALDVFFLRPGGSLGRWEFGPDEAPPEWITELSESWPGGAQAILCGEPAGDFSRLRKSLERAKVLYDREEGWL